MAWASRGFFAWFAIALFYALQYVLRVMPNTLSVMIMEKFDVGAFSLGQFSALYYIGYTAAHIPLGILIDRYGPKRVVPAFMALTFLSATSMLFNSWEFVQIGRVLTGVGSAAAALSIFKVSSMYFSQKFARMTSIAMIIGFLGAMYGGIPLLSLIESFGWNSVFLMIIVAGCALSIIAAVVLFDTDKEGERESVLTQTKRVVCNKHLIGISLLGGCMIGPLEGFGDGWATAFLSEVCVLSAKVAAILPSTIFIGSCVGSFVLSYMFEKKSYDAWNMIIGCGVFAILAFSIMMTRHCGGEVGTFALLMVIGFCSAYQIVAVCKAISYVGREAVALATAISNMMIMVFGYLFHTVIASVINWGWDGSIDGGQVAYGSELLIKAILVVPFGLLVGTLGFVWVKYKERSRSIPN